MSIAERYQRVAAEVAEAAMAAGRAPELLFLALALLVSAASVACGLLFTNYAFAGLIATGGVSVLSMRAMEGRAAAVARAAASRASLARM